MGTHSWEEVRGSKYTCGETEAAGVWLGVTSTLKLLRIAEGGLIVRVSCGLFTSVWGVFFSWVSANCYFLSHHSYPDLIFYFFTFFQSLPSALRRRYLECPVVLLLATNSKHLIASKVLTQSNIYFGMTNACVDAERSQRRNRTSFNQTSPAQPCCAEYAHRMS